MNITPVAAGVTSLEALMISMRQRLVPQKQIGSKWSIGKPAKSFIGVNGGEMNTNDPLDIVRYFSGAINNGRTLRDIARHAESELGELYEEVDKVTENQPEGSDGVVGESIDIIACALDAIFFHRPETTNEEICAILLAKCEKWARRYGTSVDGDRSIN